jgi:hypothetical protein
MWYKNHTEQQMSRCGMFRGLAFRPCRVRSIFRKRSMIRFQVLSFDHRLKYPYTVFQFPNSFGSILHWHPVLLT